jgi:hypothetical protein
MSVSGYNLIPNANDEHVIDVDYDERYNEITMCISNGNNSEEIPLTIAEFKALIRQMTAIAEYIERQK